MNARKTIASSIVSYPLPCRRLGLQPTPRDCSSTTLQSQLHVAGAQSVQGPGICLQHRQGCLSNNEPRFQLTDVSIRLPFADLRIQERASGIAVLLEEFMGNQKCSSLFLAVMDAPVVAPYA